MDYFAAMRAFVRAVELKSFSKVAAEAGAKVSTVSRHVGGLEADLGAALLNRSTRGLSPTEAGRTFYRHAVQILADLDQARSATTALNARPQGLLRVNAPGAFGRLHLMPHMAGFLAAYPDIGLDLTLTDVTVDLIEAGADIALRIGALVDSALIAKRVAPQRRVLVASAAYLDRRRQPAAPDELGRHDCLGFALQPTGAWYCRPIDRPDAEPRAVTIDGRLRANDSEVLRDAALAGLGIALLPTWLVAAEISDGRLLPVLPDWEWLMAPGPERAIWLVYPPKRIVSPKVRCFIAFVTERFGRPPYWDRDRPAGDAAD